MVADEVILCSVALLALVIVCFADVGLALMWMGGFASGAVVAPRIAKWLR